MTDPKGPGAEFEAWGVDWPPAPESSEPMPGPDAGETAAPGLAGEIDGLETPPSQAALVEGLLFLGDKPVTPALAARAIPGMDSPGLVRTILALNRRYRSQNRPYAIRRRDDGYEMALLPRHGPLEDRLRGEPRTLRIEGSLLDTLAIVAFRQPVAKAAVDGLKGGDTGQALRQLVRLGLVTQQGGGKGGYVTTPAFLKLFQIDRIEDIPRPADLEGA